MSRESGIEQSSQASGDEWREYATVFLRLYLQQNPTMHVDELWDAGLERPVSARALGAVVLHAKKNGWIRTIEASHGIAAKPSRLSNMQIKPVWHSCLFEQAKAA